MRELPGISPAECAAIARTRFAPDVMVEGYLRVYAGVIANAGDDSANRPELANA